MKLSFLYGLRFSDWVRLLRDTGFDIDPRGVPSAFLITLMSLQNSWLARGDRHLLLDEVEVVPPVFILGHWRSGTTHLHYLLAQDPQLGTPTTYQCAYPWSFVSSERRHSRALAPFAPTSRPQDNMAFGLHTPQEDEFALTVLCRRTPMMAWAFPRLMDHYLQYLTFESASDADREAFTRAMRLFLRKLAVADNRPMILKSPGHTARVRLLTQEFPGARFVHICRNPYDVYRSSLHLYRTFEKAFAFLQRPDPSTTEEMVLSLYEQMYRAYLAQRALLPPGRSHEVKFEDLKAEPMAQMQKLYDEVGLEHFPEGELARYLDSLQGYRQNRYEPLDERTKARIAERWGFAFEAFGYER